MKNFSRIPLYFYFTFTEEEELNPCEPSPCGVNAVCKQQNGAGSCSCIPDYHGNPYEGCRPECILSSDCSPDKSCIRSKCVDPCPGICGTYATCTVINHIPSCNCINGYYGDPFTGCRSQPTQGLCESPNVMLVYSVRESFYIYFLINRDNTSS